MQWIEKGDFEVGSMNGEEVFKLLFEARAYDEERYNGATWCDEISSNEVKHRDGSLAKAGKVVKKPAKKPPTKTVKSVKQPSSFKPPPQAFHPGEDPADFFFTNKTL